MEKTGSKPTSELVRLAIIGDATAFTRLWDTNIESLKIYIRGLIKSLDDFYVDDICSRSFEKAFRQIKNFDPSRSQFPTWLRTIAHNTALDVLDSEERKNRQLVSLDDTSSMNSPVLNFIQDEVDTPLESIIRTEDNALNEKYVDALPELYRQVARMRLVDSLQYKEIAEECGLELNTVRTRIRRAKALIEKMKGEENGV